MKKKTPVKNVAKRSKSVAKKKYELALFVTVEATSMQRAIERGTHLLALATEEINHKILYPFVVGEIHWPNCQGTQYQCDVADAYLELYEKDSSPFSKS